MYAKRTGLYDFGYYRNKRSDLSQVDFDVAELSNLINIPIDLSIDRRNASNPVQFVKIVGDLLQFAVRFRCRRGCQMNLREEYEIYHRKRLNVTDDAWIYCFNKYKEYCVDDEDGVYC